MNTTRREIDWQDVHSRLEQICRRLDTGEGRSPDEVERILRERASALAKPLSEVPSATALLDLLVCSIAGERYGIETVFVLEVIPCRDLIPVPCTPPFMLGVIHHRGRILPVLEFRKLFNLPGHDAAEAGRVVAVQAMRMTFGIFVNAVLDTVRVAVQDVTPPPPTFAGEYQAIIRGVTTEIVAVLDLEALARDPRIIVNEEVG